PSPWSKFAVIRCGSALWPPKRCPCTARKCTRRSTAKPRRLPPRLPSRWTPPAACSQSFGRLPKYPLPATDASVRGGEEGFLFAGAWGQENPMKPTVAIVGASTNRSKYGNKAVRAYARQGYEVYPIHPQADSIEGHKAYRSVLNVPVDQLDRVSIYLPPEIGLQVIDDIARK